LSMPTNHHLRYALKMAAIYALFGAVWIFFSDRLLLILADGNVALLTTLQTWKGWFYVLVTALFAFFLLLRTEARFRTAMERINRLAAESSNEQGRREQTESELVRLAHYDPLTDLPNRNLLHARIEHALAWAGRHRTLVALHHIDLDQFRLVNDSLGHHVGDELLVAVSRRLAARCRQDDTLARVGADEFILLQEPVAEPQEATVVARDLLAVLAAPFHLAGGHEIYLAASIGIGIFPNDGENPADLLKNAEAAMFHAKENGRNQLCFYTERMNTDALARLQMEAGLRQALERRELLLYYQPKVEMTGGRMSGAEALIRWQRPDGSLVSPAEFIPVAEKTGLIVAIGEWVLDEACRQLRAWKEEGLPELKLAVNVSARQFRAGNLAEVVAATLARHRVAPNRLELELTESTLMEQPEQAAVLLAKCAELGVSIALDDFGTGYSSFAYLSRFPINVLKIDRSFVQEITTRPDAAMIADSIIALARRMGIRVVAEGVETEAQLAYLRRRGCDQMQGYLYSRPLPAADFAALLASGKTLPLGESEATGKRTLLLVDDDPTVLNALQRCLAWDGYHILVADSGFAGLEMLARHPVQVILSDERMPGMSGTKFLGQVKDMYPDTVRIVLSGYSELETITAAINQGAIYKFLSKPWDVDLLREHLRDAFRYHEAVLKPRPQDGN